MHGNTCETVHQEFTKSNRTEDSLDLVAPVLCIAKRTKLSIKNLENQLIPRTLGFSGGGALYRNTHETEHQECRKPSTSEDPWDLVAGMLGVGNHAKLNITNPENQ